MLPLNPNKMKQMLRTLGISQEEIKAKKVIIEKAEGNIIIEEPNVIKIKAQGEELFQISGKIREQKFSEEDISIVMQQANVNREDAIKALEKSNGDIAEAILSLKSS